MSLFHRLNSSDADFQSQLAQLLAWESVADKTLTQRVDDIIAHIRSDGDQALIEYTQKFDQFADASIEKITLSKADLEAASKRISQESLAALKQAAQRVESFHVKQKQDSWRYDDGLGNQLGQQITALDKVGVYVPGGKAAYPSSVLMNTMPAKVAGVEQVVMVTPAMHGEVNDMVLAAAWVAGVDQVFLIGGAQAVAALAYGTQSVPRVDKIVGPGNSYVAAAKRAVFGQVGIDMIAGPSEVLVISDGNSNPEWIAMDLFSQAEHDELAQALLISHDETFLKAVEQAIEKLLPTMEREEIIRASMKQRGALIQVANLDEAIELSNTIAPEHLELAIDNAEDYVSRIRHAGAIFVGRHTPEALGDYCAGPNHVLPTSGTARFSSPLGVYDFQKKSSIIFCSQQGSQTLAQCASVLAREEHLTAHARSAEFRLNQSPDENKSKNSA